MRRVSLKRACRSARHPRRMTGRTHLHAWTIRRASPGGHDAPAFKRERTALNEAVVASHQPAVLFVVCTCASAPLGAYPSLARIALIAAGERPSFPASSATVTPFPSRTI